MNSDALNGDISVTGSQTESYLTHEDERNNYLAANQMEDMNKDFIKR